MAVIDRNDPRRKGPPEYVHQDWPSWRYGPDGQSQIFHNEDEVPDGWEDHPSKVGKTEVKSFAGDAINDDDERVEKLVDGKTGPQLLEILEEAQKEDDSVEFLKSWPKLKLAKTIVAHDIEVEFDEDEE